MQGTHHTELNKDLKGVLLLAFLAGLAIYATFAGINYRWQWAGIWDDRELVLKGWLWTLLISICAMILAVVVGVLLVAGQRGPFRLLRLFCRGVVEFARGTPLLVLLLLGYYGIANAMRFHSAVTVGILVLALFSGAYLSEIFRGAWESISASQLEAAQAVGFSRVQVWRWVMFPQALRRALPGTAGQLVSLIKDSSLLSVIGVEEMTQMVRTANARSYTALEGFLPLALLYLALTLPLSWWARRLEAKYRYDS